MDSGENDIEMIKKCVEFLPRGARMYHAHGTDHLEGVPQYNFQTREGEYWEGEPGNVLENSMDWKCYGRDSTGGTWFNRNTSGRRTLPKLHISKEEEENKAQNAKEEEGGEEEDEEEEE